MLAHPSREHLLGRIEERLQGAPLEVVWNDQSPWLGMQDVLARDLGTPHLVVLQDDSIPCQNFPAVVQNVIRQAPDRLIALFHAKGKPHGAAATFARAADGTLIELRFTRGSDWLPTVGLVWPAALVAAFARYRWAGSRNQRGDDLPVGQFARQHGGALACVPSIVQHPDDTPSVWISRRAGHGRVPTRTAARYADDGGPWAT